MLNLPGDKKAEYMELLFPFAYNIIGSAEDAKDAVQDVILKMLLLPREDIADEKNYLIRSVINTAINIKTKQKKLQAVSLPWLPEPVVTDQTADINLHLDEVLSYSLLLLMERLNARERAIFILKETFDYSHADIAGLLGISEEFSRKLLSRAKAGLFKPARKKETAVLDHERKVLARFMYAIRNRDIAQLEMAMAADISFYGDGGGKAALLATECHGSPKVQSLLVQAYFAFLQSAEFYFTQVNHQPALVTYRNGLLNSCLIFEINPETDLILQINAVLDPAKLNSLTQRRFSDSI